MPSQAYSMRPDELHVSMKKNVYLFLIAVAKSDTKSGKISTQTENC